jgi:hypothetical protein
VLQQQRTLDDKGIQFVPSGGGGGDRVSKYRMDNTSKLTTH